jgi:hypothetical protein
MTCEEGPAESSLVSQEVRRKVGLQPEVPPSLARFIAVPVRALARAF